MQTERALPRALALGLWLALGLALAYGAFRGGTEAPRGPRGMAASGAPPAFPIAGEASVETGLGTVPASLPEPEPERILGTRAPPGTTAIVVRDVGSRAPLPGVVVHAVSDRRKGLERLRSLLRNLASGSAPPKGEAWTSDAEGVVYVSLPPGGRLLWAGGEADGAVRWGQLKIAPETASVLGDLWMESHAPLDVQVVDGLGAPVAAARVELKSLSRGERNRGRGRTALGVDTDAEGRARFPWGRVLVGAVDARWQVGVVGEPDDSAWADVGPNRPAATVSLRVPATGAVRVRLVDAEGRPDARQRRVHLVPLDPNGDAVARLDRQLVTQDATALFGGLRAGARLRVSAGPSFRFAELDAPAAEGEVVEVELEELGVPYVEGTVVDEDGAPVDAAVRAWKLRDSGSSSASFEGGGSDDGGPEVRAPEVRIEFRRGTPWAGRGQGQLELELDDGRIATASVPLPLQAGANDFGEAVARSERVLAALRPLDGHGRPLDVDLRVSLFAAVERSAAGPSPHFDGEWIELATRPPDAGSIEVLGPAAPPLRDGELDLLVEAEDFGSVRLGVAPDEEADVRLDRRPGVMGAVVLPKGMRGGDVEVRALAPDGSLVASARVQQRLFRLEAPPDLAEPCRLAFRLKGEVEPFEVLEGVWLEPRDPRLARVDLRDALVSYELLVVDRSGFSVEGRFRRLDPLAREGSPEEFRNHVRLAASAPAVDLEILVDGHEPSVHSGVKPGDVLVVD